MSGMPGMSSSPSEAAPAGCEGSSPSLKLVAKDSVFDTDCLGAPADTAITIAFDNQDPGIPHNVSIFTDSSATEALFTGETITGPDTITYKVGKLPAGTYFFRCDIHPTTMTGTLTVS